MPCMVVHLSFAERVLEEWQTRPALAPIKVEGTELKQAFLQGAVGPDMGFLPGSRGFRFISELAHYHRPADLLRELVGAARTPAQLAYAWGWLTHILVDVELHPVVGRACGELLLGDASVRMNAMDSEMTHVSLEVGIDLAVREDQPEAGGLDVRSGLPVGEVDFIVDAFEATYQTAFSVPAFQKAHTRSIWLNAAWPWVLRAVSAPSSLAERGLKLAARGVVGRTGAAAAALTPIAPERWVLDRMLGSNGSLLGRLQELSTQGLGTLENRNLETGQPGETDPDHPPAVSVRDRLYSMRGVQDPVPTPSGV